MPTLEDVLKNTGAPLGCIQPNGVVVVSWNMQGWYLLAPQPVDEHRYLPCERCGTLLAVLPTTVAKTCERCCALYPE